jgi:hypothetical protein
MSKKNLVYISGPMSTGGGDLAQNIYKGALVAKALIKAGIAVVCPHYNGLLRYPTAAWQDKDTMERVSVPYEAAVDQDLRVVEACDLVYRMPGDSDGTDREVQHALSCGIPVLHDLATVYSQAGQDSFNSMTYQEMDWLQNYLDERAIYFNKHGDSTGSGKAYALSVAKPLGEAPQEKPDAKPIPIEVTSAKGYLSPTGGIKDGQDGRGDFSLLPYESLRQVAEHLRVACEKKGPDGKKKYARNNWRKGIGLARIVSALRRHSAQLGEDNDDYHLPAILAESLFACQIIADIKSGRLPKELDDVDGPYKALDWKMY